MRADRLLTMTVAHPLMRLVMPSAADKLPILMYHSVASDADERVRPYYRTVTTPQSFSRQMRCLAEAGYRGVTLAEAVRHWRASTPQPERLVAITFDDGFEDVCSTAVPIMQAHGFTGTVFLSTQ